MKIAVIHSIFKPEVRGGAEVVVDNIAFGLKQKGEEVFVICVGRKNVVDVIDGLKVYRVKPFNFFNFLDINQQPAWLRLFWHKLDMFNLVQARRIYKILKKEKPNLVLTHNLKGLGYLTSVVIRFLKLKNIQTIHDMQLLNPSGLLDDRRFPLVALYRWCCKKLFNSPEAVVFPSHYIKGVYEQFGFFKNSKKIVLGNPIYLSSRAATPAYRQGRRDPDSNFQFLFLGQVETYKGILDLIEAVKGVPGDFGLNVVGEGKALLEAKNRAQGDLRIKFCGRLSQEELESNIWPQIDILVNPSQTPESFGMVVIEAMAHGVPALVSNIGALPELVQDGQTGFVIKGNNYQEKIEWCLAHQDELKDMRESCLKEAEKYGIENYLDKILAL